MKNGDTNTTGVAEHTWKQTGWIGQHGLHPASFLKVYNRVVAYTPPVCLYEPRAWTSPCFVSFFVNIIMIGHLLATPTPNTHAQYHHH